MCADGPADDLDFYDLEFMGGLKHRAVWNIEDWSVRSIALITADDRVLKVLADLIDAVFEFLESWVANNWFFYKNCTCYVYSFV